MSAKPKLVGAALAPLVYWLLVITGLAGITVLRFGSYGSFVTSDDVFSLWAGSVIGVALGMAASAARIRAWVPAVVTMFGFWFLLPILALVIDGIFGANAQTFVLAFLPAAICGYLALTERGALLSFWYPAVLWMIVILDGPTPGVFDERFALPFVVGLAALFVVYLRARETRRVAIWKAHANERLAEAKPRTVLRGSPLRAASQHVFSAMAGACALVLTAWIAPHLWETAKDPWHGAAHASQGRPYDGRHLASASFHGASPCCPANGTQRERVKEYFPLQNAKETFEDSELGECRVCTYQGPSSGISQFTGPWSYGGSPGSGLGGYSSGVHTDDSPSSPYTYGYGSGEANPNGGYDPYAVTSTPTPAPTPPPPPIPEATPAPVPLQPTAWPATTATAPVVTKAATPSSAIHPAPATAIGDGPATTTTTMGTEVAPTTAPVASSTITLPAPWKSSLALCTIAFGFILFSRATRRALTLRHLARPFWNESIDQRISNHWQRILIGLRDAGLQPREGEQPGVFARRIGIEGLETCATILERVRHGVRVEADDLREMSAAAHRVFDAARQRAGVAGRATAWLRWPMV